MSANLANGHVLFVNVVCVNVVCIHMQYILVMNFNRLMIHT